MSSSVRMTWSYRVMPRGRRALRMYRVEEMSSWGRGGQAAGVVVGQDHHGGVQGQGLGGDLPQADLVGVGGTLAEGAHTQELALAVEAGQEGLLVPGPKEVGGEQGVKGGTVREDHLRAGAGGQVPGSDGGDELQQDHGVLPPPPGPCAAPPGRRPAPPPGSRRCPAGGGPGGSRPPGGGSRTAGSSSTRGSETWASPPWRNSCFMRSRCPSWIPMVLLLSDET